MEKNKEIESQGNKLGTEKIGKLIISMAAPAVVAQLVNVLYNIIDRMYIGRIEDVGSLALTGLGVCFPIITLISAFSAFVGAGGAPLAAIQMGKQNYDEAERILGNSVSALLALTVVLTTFFYYFKEPFLYAFGGSNDTIYYSLQYLDTYLFGTIFVLISLGLNMFITCQGNSKVAMLSVLIGAIVNIVLDPIFIFGFNMGVKGAALATIISQACSAIWVIRFLTSSKSTIRIKAKNLKIKPKVLAGIAALGISPFIMQSTESLITVALNKGLQSYGGDLYVGAMTIMQSVMQIIVIPTMGITQGTQPIISYNYGANNIDRVRRTFKYVLSVTFCVTTISCIVTMMWPEVFAMIFTPDKSLIEIVSKAMPIYMAGIWIFGVQMACQAAFVGLGKAGISLFLALLRKVFLLLPLVVILPKSFGVMGIFYAEPIADITAALVTGALFYFSLRKIIKNSSEINL
ncbi:MAG: MATE family efflux transporter [Aminipila sp.]